MPGEVPALHSADMTFTHAPGKQGSYGTDPGDPARARVVGGAGDRLDHHQVTTFVTDALAGADLDGARVCLVVPDGTRTCPLPLLLQAARRACRAGPRRSRW